jgi:hypothetical protein
MRKAKIVEVQQDVYKSTLENRGMRQRDKLEETIVNLASFLGAKAVKKACIQDGSYMYSVDSGTYQSASNVILELSRKIVGQQA